MEVVINCQAYMYVEIYTQLEEGEKMISTNTFYVPPPLPATPLSNWTAEKSTSKIRISLGLTWTLWPSDSRREFQLKGPVNEIACWPAVASLVGGILKVQVSE